ncbi:MAG TPA: TPM domain-containing protein [Candidatus Nitrosopolaris sp.]|nr:TPM domain-containing protein [Candidatus Nitrosopolaris sp.]
MRSVAWGVLLAALAVAAHAAPEPVIPAPQGFVTDRAGVVAPDVERRLERLLEELRQKTGAEIAVVTVDTTAPLDDFSYALRIAEAWKPGRKGEDTGIVFLVAVRDRKVRILTGYGLEGILPDGLVGEIRDQEIVPAFRAGHLDDGIWRGTVALASRIAAARGVELTGVPTRQQAPEVSLPPWLVFVLVLLFLALMVYGARQRPSRFGRAGGFSYPYGGFGGGFGSGGGGFGGGSGGFGFGGGGFGGGGAGGSW